MFCYIKGDEGLGYAKVVDASDISKITIEYFDSPENTSRKTVKKSLIIPKKLGANTRVYYFSESYGRWLVGRVRQDLGNEIEVRFSDKRDVFLDYENIFVRWKKPISSPVEYLARFITETPQYAEDRSGFLRTYIAQRGSSWGISALLSSIIELEPHQVNVIRRVLGDPSQRYLLADEVGLGKTIEAGVIIRQAVLDDPKGHCVVVLVPQVLVEQWREELICRFGLIEFIDQSVEVIGFDEILSETNLLLQKASLLVIDEAHHLTSLSGDQSLTRLYECVRAHAPRIERILLLSATPVLRNESGFLRMLHLLDPVVYSLNNEEGFRAKIHHRQILAESVAMLDPQNALYLDSVLDELLLKLPDDERLHELINSLRGQLVGVPEEDDPELMEAIRLLRAHLSETYRLHRRILRNRRKHVQGVTPNRSGASEIVISESRLEQIESLVEAWRINASTNSNSSSSELARRNLIDFYWRIVNALLVSPLKIKEICKSRIETLRDDPTFSFNDEGKILKEISEIAGDELWKIGRINYIKSKINSIMKSKSKVVIFCSDSEIADDVFIELFTYFKNIVVRHSVIDEDKDGRSWHQFNENDDVKVIVCDKNSEEGINLQGGNKVVVHFDLPLEPNRIEQRIGRVDRYGSGEPVQSIVLVDGDSKYQRAWFSFLNVSLGVFSRSISSLQYLIDEHLQLLQTSLFYSGLESIVDLHQLFGGQDGKVEKELKLIDQQDALDELSSSVDNEMDDLYDVDENWEDIKRLTLRWAIDSLMFGEISETKDGIDPPIRFQYRVPGGNGVSSLIAVNGFLDDFLGALDYANPHSTASRPLTYPHCARRQTAVKRGTRLLRFGDEFVESLKSFSELDDRGRSYAMWRQVYEDIPDKNIRLFFRFDFLIEVRLDGALKVLDLNSAKRTDTASAAVSRRGDSLFPPFVTQVWVDDEGEEVSSDFVFRYLSMPYAKHGKPGCYIDTNLKSTRLIPLAEVMPDVFVNWPERCERMLERARTIVLNKENISEAKEHAIKHARVEDEIREAQLRTRIVSLDGVEAQAEKEQLHLERQLSAALYRGIETPLIKTDVAGMVILSNMPFPRLS